MNCLKNSVMGDGQPSLEKQVQAKRIELENLQMKNLVDSAWQKECLERVKT